MDFLGKKGVSADNQIIPLDYAQLGNNYITWCSLPGKEVEPLTPDRIAAVEVESAANVYNERLFKNSAPLRGLTCLMTPIGRKLHPEFFHVVKLL